jgi:sulfide:quinone oxidoreductase
MSSVSSARHRVVIAGGGVAGLEALLALHALAHGYVDLTLLDPSDAFTLRALSVQDPFAPAEPHRYDLQRICDEHGVTLVRDLLGGVDLDARAVRTASGAELPFDSLLLALGTRAAAVHPEALTFRGARDAAAIQELLAAVERGEAQTIAFVVPPRTTWSLPLYELALMTAQRARALDLDQVELTFVTPEEGPLHVFGAEASAAVAAELDEAGIELIASGYTESVREGLVAIHHAGHERELEVDAVVALPRLEGPAPRGVPTDAEGFLSTDPNGRVRGTEGIFAAGDGTDFPVKQGGIAAQQADAAAHAIAQRAGVDVDLAPFKPVLRGRLLTGGGSRFLRQLLTGGEGETSRSSAQALWWPPSKVAAPYLAPYLERLDLRDEGFAAPPAPAAETVEMDVLGGEAVKPRLGTSGPGGTHQRSFAREVPRERWESYLDAVAAERVDTRTVIEVHGPEIGAQTEERGLLLRALSYDVRGDVIEVAVARPRPGGEDILRHLVDRPARLLVDSQEGILPRAIAVDDGDGNRTLVQLMDEASFSG